MKISKFEDLEVWQEARRLAVEVYKVTSVSTFEHDWALRDQIRRAVVSIMANIAEGYGRNSHREFARFLNYALGSASEIKSHLYLANDLNYLTDDQCNLCHNITDNVCRQLSSFIKYLKSKNK